jgi:hypothetical protein
LGAVDFVGQKSDSVPAEETTQMVHDAVQQASIFLQVQYPEWKDIIKSFLTLSSGTLVFSVTFSEKVVVLHTATRNQRRTMMACWALLIASIVFSVVALCLLSWASSAAAYQSSLMPELRMMYSRSFWEYAGAANFFLLIAGIAFVSSLICLTVAGYSAATGSRPTD